MIIKSIAFNMEDPDQRAMLEHARRRPNFSGYVKRLIQRDMEGANPSSHKPPENKETPVSRELVKGLI